MPPLTQEQVTNDKMSLKDISIATAPQSGVQTTVSASDISKPPQQVTVPEPQVGSIPAGTLNVARNVSRNAQGFIEAQTAESQRLKELQETYGGLTEQGSLSDFFTSQREEFGATPEALKELQDIQLRLNDMDTESGVTQTRIEGAAGQTLATAQREVTQEQRENAVRSAGLAARAAVIQGNIQTATQLAKDAVNIEYQDRQLEATNLLNQINMVQGQVDSQTAQLLEEEKRVYEAELAKIQEVKDNVANAMVNGATQTEISQLTSDSMGDDEKIALAQSITARGAGEMRSLEMQQRGASIRASNASAKLSELEAEVTQSKIDEASRAVENGQLLPEQAEVVTELSKQLLAEPSYKEMFEIRAGYNTAKVGSEQNNGFGDIAMVNGYQRMIDPGATVRGEDIKTQAEAVSYIQQTLNIKGQVLKGDRFTPETRKKLDQAIDAQYKQRIEDFDSNTRARYEDRISSNPLVSGVVDFADIGDDFKVGGSVAQSSEAVDPVTLPVGATFSISGVVYQKRGEDSYLPIQSAQ